MTIIDNVVVVVCFIGILLVGYYFSKTSQDMDSFYKANRALPWSLVVLSLIHI